MEPSVPAPSCSPASSTAPGDAVTPRIHATAIVDRRSELAGDVVVGPYAIVEAGVVLGPGCVLHAHAMVRGPARLGPRNVVHPFSVIGGEPQAKQRAEGPALLEVGEGNVFREHSTVHGGTDGRTTRVGDHNLFMVASHVAHDVVVGCHCVFANAVQLAGHAVIEDWVTFGGLSGVTQHVRVGESAFVAGAAVCERRVPPFVVVQGDRARVRGLNVVGLRRRGVPPDSIAALERAVRRLWLSRLTRQEAVRSLAAEHEPFVRKLLCSLAEEVP
jgi:UDP-N-acetylglucosamine acyltransferase